MFVRQIHAYACLLQSNIRSMLARHKVARILGNCASIAAEKRRERRHKAALRLQAWFMLIQKVTMARMPLCMYALVLACLLLCMYALVLACLLLSRRCSH
jgi:hypothetical protein